LARVPANPFFPVNTLAVMRGAIAAHQFGIFGRCVDESYRHMWGDPRKLDDPAMLRAALAESGFDPDALHALTEAQDVKDTLLGNTRRLVEQGTFGSQTFFRW
jgi:2-hydroxychromene-2-carboxylate isomerase